MEDQTLDTQALGEKIVKVLKSIYDPEIPVDIYELGLIYDVFVNEDNNVKILMTLTSRFEFGAAIGGYGKFTLLKNVVMENVLNLYSNYLEDPQNIDIDYTISLVMSVNKWITANVAFQAIYDDNAAKGFQIREALGVGLTYGF